MDSVKNLMSAPISIELSSNLYQALKKMMCNKISRLLLNDSNNIAHIVSEKDLGLFLFSDTSERNLDEIPLSEVSKKIITVNEDSDMKACSKKFLEFGIGSLGVTSNNNVVGIITKTDLVRYFSNNYSGKKTVGEYMTPYYAWQYSDFSLSRIISKMIEEKISRIVLRDRNEDPVGMLSFRDLFNISLNLGQDKDVLDNTDPLISVIFPRKGFVSESGFGGSTKASEIMSAKIVSVNYDADLGQTGKLLLEKGINGAGVLSKNGRLVGIISKTDIVRALAFIN